MNLRRLTLPADKANHAIWGALVALPFLWLAAAAGVPEHAGLVATLGALAVGGIKELADWLDNEQARAAGLPLPHTVDAVDVMATAAGGLALWAALGLAGP